MIQKAFILEKILENQRKKHFRSLESANSSVRVEQFKYGMEHETARARLAG